MVYTEESLGDLLDLCAYVYSSVYVDAYADKKRKYQLIWA